MPAHTWGLGSGLCSAAGALLAAFDCFSPLEHGHSWDQSFMEGRDKKVPADVLQLQSGSAQR